MTAKVSASDFARAKAVLGFSVNAPDLAAAGVVVLAGIVDDLQEQNRALAARVDALEAAQPKSFPGRALTAAARIFS